MSQSDAVAFDHDSHKVEMLGRLLPYLDKHLALGLLSFYEQRGVDVTDAIDQLLSATALTPEGNVKPEHEEKIKATTEIALPALNEFFDTTTDFDYTYQFRLPASEVEHLRTIGELSFEYLSERKGITKAVMRAVMELAYLFYDKGTYGGASELLTLCRCVSGFDLPSEALLWGKLMCDTGARNWRSAIDIAAQIQKLQNADESEMFRQDSKTTVRERAWLLHWILFPFFKGGSQYPVNLLFYVFDYKSEFVFQSVVETVCPHYLRYICAAAILNRSRYVNFRSAATMADRIYEYSDPLTRLVLLINKSSFEEALALLPDVERVIQDDYFLCDLEEEIVQNAKRMIFEKYMSLHSVVSIPYVADRLNMSTAEAEVWLVNLLGDSRQRAKIDSVNEQLNVEPQTRSVEATIYDRLESASRRESRLQF